MRRRNMVGSLAVLCWCFLVGSGTASVESQKTEGSKGITVDDLGRGLKSAEQNVEKEIPKIGPAIADTFKKVTGKAPSKQPNQSPSKDKK